MKRLILASLAVSGASGIVRADSIWDRRDPRYAHLFQDTRARQVGDLLTVVISDSTVTNMQDQRAMNKTTSGSGSVSVFGTGTTTFGGTGTSTGTPAPGVVLPLPAQSTARAFNGSANQTTNRVFNDRMAVTVVDMMPNGNLVVEGYRSQVVAGEERVLRITGIVRQADIASGNVVTSNTIANFRISYLGRGPATKFTNQGPLGRLGNLLSPF